MSDVVIEAGLLPYVPLSWHRIPRYKRDEHGDVVLDPRTRQPIRTALSKMPLPFPIGWTDHDADGLVWALG